MTSHQCPDCGRKLHPTVDCDCIEPAVLGSTTVDTTPVVGLSGAVQRAQDRTARMANGRKYAIKYQRYGLDP